MVRLAPRLRPADQPAWARPALLAIAVVAALAYGRGMAGASVEPFYGAAARSMSESWHDFAFGAFDPASTGTLRPVPSRKSRSSGCWPTERTSAAETGIAHWYQKNPRRHTSFNPARCRPQ
jgi:hypothetical protein